MTPFETLYTRPDGQVFGIETHVEGMLWQSVVPKDMAEDHGFTHTSKEDCRRYLMTLINMEPK